MEAKINVSFNLPISDFSKWIWQNVSHLSFNMPVRKKLEQIGWKTLQGR